MNGVAVVFRVIGASCLLFSFAAANATVIDTYPDWHGGFWGEFGANEQVRTFGQSFVAPSESHLASFRLSLAQQPGTTPPGGDQFLFRLYVVGWSVRQCVGAVLYESEDRLSPSGHDFVPYDFSPNIDLVPGESYVAFVSTAGITQAATGQAWIAHTAVDSYAGGMTSATNGDWWTSWGFAPQNEDEAIRAEFGPVPEPTSLLALSLSVCFLCFRRRFR